MSQATDIMDYVIDHPKASNIEIGEAIGLDNDRVGSVLSRIRQAGWVKVRHKSDERIIEVLKHEKCTGYQTKQERRTEILDQMLDPLMVDFEQAETPDERIRTAKLVFRILDRL